MCFEKIKLRVASVIQPGARPERATLETAVRRILVERILRSEYEFAQAEFDHAKRNPGMDADVQAGTSRYFEATVRLRKFLAEGEVPRDVTERLNAELH